MVSAYLRLLIFLLAILIPACASFSPAFGMMYTAYKLNKQDDDIHPWWTPFSIWNQSIVPCLVLTIAFLTCIQVSQEAGKMVWYSHLFKNFPWFVVIHAVKGFSIVSEVEVDFFLCFFMIQWVLAIWSLVPLLFIHSACTSGSSWFTYYWSLA